MQRGKGVLRVNYRSGKQEERKLICAGGPKKARRKLHWLAGFIYHGHTKLNAGDVVGVLESFAVSKNIETTAVDTGVSRITVGALFDRLRMAAAMVIESQHEELIFSHCQVSPACQLIVHQTRTGF